MPFTKLLSATPIAPQQWREILINPPYQTRAIPLRPFAAPPLDGRVQSPAFRLSLANQHAKAWTLNTLAILRPDLAQRSKRDCASLSLSRRDKAAKKIENDPRGKREDERDFSRFSISSFSRFPSIQSLAFSLFVIISAFYSPTAHAQDDLAQRKTRIYNAACNHYNAGYDAMQDGQYNKALAEYNACSKQCKRFKKLLKKPRPVAEPLLEQIEEILDYIRMDIKDMDAEQKKKGMARYKDFYIREDRLKEARKEVDFYEELRSLKIDADRSFNHKQFGPAIKLYTSLIEKGAAIPSMRSRTGIDGNPLSPIAAPVESLIEQATERLELSKELKVERQKEIAKLYEERRHIIRDILPPIQPEDLQDIKTIDLNSSGHGDAKKMHLTPGRAMTKSAIRNPKSEIDLMGIISRRLADSYLRAADEHYQEGRYDMARAQYQKVFSESPDSPAAQKAIQRIVTIRVDTGKDGLSECHKWIATLKDANQINSAQLAIAQYFYKRRDYDRALAELEPILNPVGQSEQGKGVEEQRSSEDQSKDTTVISSSRHPVIGTTGTSADRGEDATIAPSSRHRVIQSSRNPVIPSSRNLVTPPIRRATLLRALIYIAKGERGDAIKELRKITASGIKDEHAARAQFLIGWVLMADQRYSQAVEAYQKLLSDYPKGKYTDQARDLIERIKRLNKVE